MDCTLSVIAALLLGTKMMLTSDQTQSDIKNVVSVNPKLYNKFKSDFNLVFPDESYPILLLYMTKPIFVKMARDCSKITNNTIYSAKMFGFRCFYDLFFIASIVLYLFDTKAISVY